MLATPIIREILRMLIEGRISQREIVKMMNVGRYPVESLAKMLREIQDARQAEAALSGSGPTESELAELLEPFERCPTCRAIVHLPCLACAVKSFIAARPRRARPLEPDALGLEFRADHHFRYETIRALRGTQPVEEMLSTSGDSAEFLSSAWGGENSADPCETQFNPDDTGRFEGWFGFSFDSSQS